ncbi:hypothetical protein DFR57_103238 [Saliterribacillus persicus]|uniref:Uncharacterized protein n=1 Tax=Saliterribacillus persicus TaxID=930114 RepID=A0A368Y3T9_9BACI|nr:hypothetical protein DFR57_103238 [Saliterribacillus persicus]
MFIGKLYCSVCEKKIEFREDYYFKGNLQDSLGNTNLKSYFKTNGQVLCTTCIQKETDKE